MDPHLLSSTAQLSNDELLTRVKHLATGEREVTVSLIAHLAELDKTGSVNLTTVVLLAAHLTPGESQ